MTLDRRRVLRVLLVAQFLTLADAECEWTDLGDSGDYLGASNRVSLAGLTFAQCQTSCEDSQTCAVFHFCDINSGSRYGECYQSSDVRDTPVSSGCSDVKNFMLTNGPASCITPPPPPTAPTGPGCYMDSTTPISTDDCTCHSSCHNCGYYNMPTAADNCITCADSNVQVNAVYSDGTGYCSTSSPTPPPPRPCTCCERSMKSFGFFVGAEDCDPEL